MGIEGLKKQNPNLTSVFYRKTQYFYIFFAGNKKPQFLSKLRSLRGKPSNVLLSLEIQPTIIGAKAFHCPVRNGKEWDHLAMVAWLSLLLKSSTLSNEFFTVNKA